MSPLSVQKKKVYDVTYRSNHKEQIKEYKQKYCLTHRKQTRKYMSEWRKLHRKEINDYNRQRRLKRKIEAFKHYSPKLVCSKCGFPDIRALSIDHVNGGGTKHRETDKVVGSDIYSWLRWHNYPEGFQVLCMNCQWIKKFENHETVPIKYL